MMPRSFSSFVVLIVIPALTFFFYTYIQVGRSISAIEMKDNIEDIVQPNSGSKSSGEVVSEVRQVADSVTASFDLISDQGLEAPTKLSMKAEQINRSISASVELLSDNGFTKGPIENRISHAIHHPKCPVPESSHPPECAPIIQRQEIPAWNAIWETGDDTYDLFFGFQNDSLTPPVEAALKELVTRKLPFKGRDIHLWGFSDRSGPERLNCRLAEHRLEQVTTFLKQNFPEIRITFTPRGENEVPSYPNEDGRKEPRNRIVRIYFGIPDKDRIGQECHS